MPSFVALCRVRRDRVGVAPRPRVRTSPLGGGRVGPRLGRCLEVPFRDQVFLGCTRATYADYRGAGVYSGCLASGNSGIPKAIGRLATFSALIYSSTCPWETVTT
jgi:hypothetical protein